MARSRRTPDPVRIASARVGGIAERCVYAGRITDDAALVEIGAALGALPEGHRREALSSAASHYVDGSTAAQRRALELLVRAGADVERARTVAATRGHPLNPPS